MQDSPSTLPLNAVDRLVRDNDAADVSDILNHLRGKNCGLVLNHTSVTRDGKSTLEVLLSRGVTITKLFSPEHGIKGVLEGHVENTVLSQLTVISLYGATRRPTEEMLQGLDVLILDLQDIGARFYTYSSTMALCLEACAEYNVEMIVSDRMNPLGGQRIEGPMIEEGLRSFIGHMRIPIVHGLTMGELARWHSSDAGLNVRLTVLQLKGWDRSLLWPATQSQWIPPSPNIPNFEAAAWYPGICLLEFNDFSVGRGTPRPFQIIGCALA